MADKEIIKALDGADVFLRNRANSEPAPLNEYDIEALLDIANVCDEAANFINRQKTEIETLKAHEEKEHQYCKNVCEPKYKAEIKELNIIRGRLIYDGKYLTKITDELYQKIKAQAVKEFAERLKAETIEVDVSYGYGREHYTEAVAVIVIDNLVKEMVGDTDV